MARVEAQAERDRHQRGADGSQELEDHAGEQRDTQGRKRRRAHVLARGCHGPLVIAGPAEGPQQRQARDQRVEPVAEPLQRGQPAPDRGRGVRSHKASQHRGRHQGQGRQACRHQVQAPYPGQQQRGHSQAQNDPGKNPGHEGVKLVQSGSQQSRHASGAWSRATPAGLVGRGQARRRQADARRQRPPPGRDPCSPGCRLGAGLPRPAERSLAEGQQGNPQAVPRRFWGGELPVQRGG